MPATSVLMQQSYVVETNNPHRREDQFTESANVSIFTGTWNVNAKKLDGELNDWLLNEQGGKGFFEKIYMCQFHPRNIASSCSVKRYFIFEALCYQ